ncbi:hypothetical protein [Thetidibacter halocola]|uniref:Lipoprotein n=1 Tax=Thetidibacter halocola TaxID=2827239 RepID=A0A8J7WG83_9RHOB|nr:hypothetical protein [Thetidibacter halocola]MBS0126222.1 hypothetical protein [Thetidibacter halocola]
MRHPLTLAACALTLAACAATPELPRLADVPVTAEAGQAAALEGVEATAPAASTNRPRRGLLGFLGRQAEAAKADETAEAAPAEPSEPPVELAAMPPETASDAAPRRGLAALFGGGRRDSSAADGLSPDAPDYRQSGPGQQLPFGEIARVCGVSAASLGRKVDSYPKNGRGYTLHDSAPGTTALHNFYIGGFDDGCARQFSAALVMFGDAETYEQIRFGPSGSNLPVSETDAAYDALKSRVCGVGKGKPCGNKVSRLARNTVFVSIYERFDSNPRWKTLLLHDGEVVALDVKTSN